MHVYGYNFERKCGRSLNDESHLANEGAPAARTHVLSYKRKNVSSCHSRKGPRSNKVGKQHGAIVQGVGNVGSVCR